MKIQSYGVTDRGLIRDHNEDNFLADEDIGLFLVADGMGGLSKGELASKIAVETIAAFIKQSRMEDITWPVRPQKDYSMEENRLLASVSLANWKIFGEFQRDENNTGMGTTLVGLLFDGDELVMVNVGDSRIYCIRDRRITQLSEDHSLVMEEVRRGKLTPEEARVHPQRNVITRALGISDSTQVDISTIRLQSGDLFILCSDGLSDMVLDEEMLSLLLEGGQAVSLQESCQKLVEAAKNRGGKDNITVLLVRVLE